MAGPHFHNDHGNHNGHFGGGNNQPSMPPFLPTRPPPPPDPKPTTFPPPNPTTNDPPPVAPPQSNPAQSSIEPPADQSQPASQSPSTASTSPQDDPIPVPSSHPSDSPSQSVTEPTSSTLLGDTGTSSAEGQDQSFASTSAVLPSSVVKSAQTSDIAIAPPETSSAASNGTGQSSSLSAGGGSKTGKIVGGVVGGLVALLLVLIPVIMIFIKRRRRDRPFSQLDDFINDSDPRWSAVYAAAVGYSASNRSVTGFGTVPIHTAQYVTPADSPQASTVGVENFPSMAHIASHASVTTAYNQQYQDKRWSPTYGESPALAVTTGESIKQIYHNTPTIPVAHGPSGSQSSNTDSEVAEIMQTLHTIRKGHSASGSDCSSSSPGSSRHRNNSDAAGPSTFAATAGAAATS